MSGCAIRIEEQRVDGLLSLSVVCRQAVCRSAKGGPTRGSKQPPGAASCLAAFGSHMHRQTTFDRHLSALLLQ